MPTRADKAAGGLKRLERRYAWSVLGFIVGVIGIVITVFELKAREPRISFVTLASSNVYDVHAPISDLDITYHGESLKRTNLNLKLIAVEVANDGMVDILQNQYDDTVPWGFRITSGRIVELKLTDASSEYLATRVSPRRLSDTQVSFNKTILDSGEAFVVSALVLHPNGTEPVVVPTGKIAGIDGFRTEKAEDDPGDSLAATFSGTLWTQGVRVLAYGLIFILLLICFLVLPAMISTRLDARRAAERRTERTENDEAELGNDEREKAVERSCPEDSFGAHESRQPSKGEC